MLGARVHDGGEGGDAQQASRPEQQLRVGLERHASISNRLCAVCEMMMARHDFQVGTRVQTNAMRVVYQRSLRGVKLGAVE